MFCVRACVRACARVCVCGRAVLTVRVHGKEIEGHDSSSAIVKVKGLLTNPETVTVCVSQSSLLNKAKEPIDSFRIQGRSAKRDSSEAFLEGVDDSGGYSRHSSMVSDEVQRLRSDEAVLHQSVQRRLNIERVAARETNQLRVPRNPVIWRIGIARVDTDIHWVEMRHLVPKITRASINCMHALK